MCLELNACVIQDVKYSSILFLKLHLSLLMLYLWNKKKIILTFYTYYSLSLKNIKKNDIYFTNRLPFFPLIVLSNHHLIRGQRPPSVAVLKYSVLSERSNYVDRHFPSLTCPGWLITCISLLMSTLLCNSMISLH